MRINCYYEFQETTHGVMRTLQVIVDKLKLKYPEIEFNSIHSHAMRDENYQSCAHQYGSYFLKIENPITKKYILVSYWDKIVNLKETNWDLENCVEILSSIGHHENDIYYKKQSLVEYTTGTSYTVTGTNINIPGKPNQDSNYSIMTQGAPFQFSETYLGPGVAKETWIDRTTETQSTTNSVSVFTQ